MLVMYSASHNCVIGNVRVQFASGELKEHDCEFATSSGNINTIHIATHSPSNTTNFGAHAWLLSSGCWYIISRYRLSGTVSSATTTTTIIKNQLTPDILVCLNFFWLNIRIEEERNKPRGPKLR